jgi:hypothetical protein
MRFKSLRETFKNTFSIFIIDVFYDKNILDLVSSYENTTECLQ